MSGGGKDAPTIGFQYLMGFHLVICHGEVDELLDAKYAERRFLASSVTSSQVINVNKPGLLGGEKREGGLVGDFAVYLGSDTESRDSYLQSKLSSTVSAYRSLVNVVARQVYYAAMNPYVKDFFWRFRRTTSREYNWYPAKVDIDGHMNPAHIIVDCLTNSAWGLGLSGSLIDETSFQASADTLYTEEFGLSFVLKQQASVNDIITDVVRHVEGAIYVDSADGLFHFDLIREVSDPETLEVIDEDYVVEVLEIEGATLHGNVNEVVINYTDDSTGEVASTPPIQHLGNIQTQGRVVTKNISYPGIYRKKLAMSVGARDLRALSTPMDRIKLACNRRASKFKPGQAVKVTVLDHGLNAVQCRVLTISGGTLKDPKVELLLMQDVFGNGVPEYTDMQASIWVDPGTDPVDLVDLQVIEAPYYTLATKFSQADFDALPDLASFGHLLVPRESQSYSSYELYASPTTSDFTEVGGSLDFCPYATISAAASQTDTVISYENDVDLDLASVGDLCYIVKADNTYEMAAITGINTGAGTLTFDRGVLDTVPVSLDIGDQIYAVETYFGLDRTERTEAESVNYKVLPFGIGGQLLEADATYHGVTFDGRSYLPYPVANVLVDGNAAFSEATITSSSFTATWKNRNRVTQIADYVSWHSTANYAEEVGTTFNVEVIRVSDDASLYLETDTAAANASAAIVLPAGNYDVMVVITSVRDSYECLHPYVGYFTIDI